jgi:hypothetical protein
MEKVTQARLIIEYLEEFGSITPLEAIRDIGCYRLSARISDIKKMGIPIDTEMVNVKNRRGKYSRIARYSLAVSADG